MLVIFFIILSMQCEAHKNTLQIGPDFSLALSQHNYELGGAFSVDYYLWHAHRYNLDQGPGLRIVGSKLAQSGNKFAHVMQHSLYLEPRYTWCFNFQKNNFATKLFMGLKAQLVAEFIRRSVLKEQSSNFINIFALGARTGVSYWLYEWGLEFAYSLNIARQKNRHEFALGLMYNFNKNN